MVLTFTIRGKNDGFGSQYLARICGYAYCQHPENNQKYKYVHTPMRKVEHNQKGIKLSQFIGIPYKNESPKVDKEQFRVPEVREDPNKYFTHSVLSKIREWYYSVQKPNINSMKEYKICVHIRRGDIADGTYKNRINYKKFLKTYFLTDEQYLKIITLLCEKYPNEKIAVFSEGNEDQFKFLKPKDNNITLFLNSDLKFTFHSMVEADVLVTGKSTLSYSAALLNKNQNIHYVDFMFGPLYQWNVLDI